MSLKSLAWLVAGLFIAATAVAKEPLPENVQKLIEGYRKGALRVNGTRLQLTAVDGKGEPDPAVDVIGPVDTVLRLHWEIDYDGPRPPLTILKPSLDPGGHSSVIVFLIAADGKDYPVAIQAQAVNIPGPWFSAKEAFATVTAKAPARGIVTVSWSRVLQTAQKKWPGQFGKAAPTLAYLQFRHSPNDRAAHLGLDAWTGSLQTELVGVRLPELGLK